MKKILIYLLSVFVLVNLFSCKEDDKYLFGEGPDERLQAKLNEYQDILCNAPYGWLVAVGTQNRNSNGGAYRLWMKFTPDNRVTMICDRNATMAVTPKTSSYRLKAMQFPTLMFDTYNYIHTLADPSAGIPGSTSGQGLESDFDFNLTTDMVGDELLAVGRVNQCPIILKRATQEEEQMITDGITSNNPVLTTIKTTVAAYWTQLKYATVDIDGFFVQFSIGNRLSSIYYQDSTESINTLLIPTYAELNRDIRLMEPIEYGNIKFDRITWTGANYAVVINGRNYEVYDHGGFPFTFPAVFGIGKTYNLLTVNKAQLNTAQGSSMVDPFLSVYNAAESKMLTNPEYGNRFHFSNFTIKFGIGSVGRIMTLTGVITDGPGGSAYQAAYTFKLNEDPDGTVYFTNFESIKNAHNYFTSIVGHGLYDNLLSYFLYDGAGTIEIINESNPSLNRTYTVVPSGNKFYLDWAPNNTPGLAAALGGFYVWGIHPDFPPNYVPGVPGKQ